MPLWFDKIGEVTVSISSRVVKITFSSGELIKKSLTIVASYLTASHKNKAQLQLTPQSLAKAMLLLSRLTPAAAQQSCRFATDTGNSYAATTYQDISQISDNVEQCGGKLLPEEVIDVFLWVCKNITFYASKTNNIDPDNDQQYNCVINKTCATPADPTSGFNPWLLIPIILLLGGSVFAVKKCLKARPFRPNLPTRGLVDEQEGLAAGQMDSQHEQDVEMDSIGGKGSSGHSAGSAHSQSHKSTFSKVLMS